MGTCLVHARCSTQTLESIGAARLRLMLLALGNVVATLLAQLAQISEPDLVATAEVGSICLGWTRFLGSSLVFELAEQPAP